jgi:hypothetical protein
MRLLSIPKLISLHESIVDRSRNTVGRIEAGRPKATKAYPRDAIAFDRRRHLALIRQRQNHAEST